MSNLPNPLRGQTLLGRYRVVMPIGRGGMGTVYLARTEGAAGFAKPVVVKAIHMELVSDESMVQMFVREARVLSQLHHAGIVNVLDFGEHEGSYLMVLEYVHGYDLGAWTRYHRQIGRAMTFDFAVHIAGSVLETLQYTHSYRRADGSVYSVVHRDISPGNILVSREGAVKLADFGIARALDDGAEYRSHVGTFKGKISYAAPELLHGDDPSPHADQYSLAVVLLEILLGDNPFHGDSMAETVQRVMTLPPPAVSEARSDVPVAFDEVLARALAKEPESRFADAQAMVTALREVQQTPADAVRLAFIERVRADFDVALPAQLGLDRLQDRDQAWRVQHDTAAAHLLVETLSSTPPPASQPTVAMRMRTDGTPVGAAELETQELALADTDGRGRSFRKSIAGWVWVLTGLVVAGTVGAIILALSREPPEPQQFVVVEQQTKPRPSEVPLPPPQTSAAADPADSLTRALHARQGRIQECFERHVAEVAGTPEISLRISLDADGRVRSSGLDPNQLETTPLGKCLLAVANKTPFPAPGRALTLRLPITARVSR